MKLSIMVLTIEERKKMFDKLIEHLKSQADEYDNVEVLYDGGEGTEGLKRNRILERAKGDFVCYVDDDDWVSDDYVDKIVTSLGDDIDCVGISGKVFIGEKEFGLVQSVKYNKISFDKKRKIYTKLPTHLNPIKRSIMKKFPFRDINNGCDYYQAMDMQEAGVLQEEKFIYSPLYFYYYNPGQSARHIKKGK